MNLGLRWEYFGQLIETVRRAIEFPAVRIPQSLSIPADQAPLQHAAFTRVQRPRQRLTTSISSAPAFPGSGILNLLNFSPRFGFAYQLTPKFVVRGGYGLFYGGFENSTVETYVDFPFQYSLSYPNLTPNAPITYPNGAIGTLETGLSAIPLTSAAVQPAGVSFTGEDYHMKTPYTQGYNFTLQYQLSPNDTVQAGYVGNTVRHLGVYTNGNSPERDTSSRT